MIILNLELWSRTWNLPGFAKYYLWMPLDSIIPLGIHNINLLPRWGFRAVKHIDYSGWTIDSFYIKVLHFFIFLPLSFCTFSMMHISFSSLDLRIFFFALVSFHIIFFCLTDVSSALFTIFFNIAFRRVSSLASVRWIQMNVFFSLFSSSFLGMI